jgi:hypothetical protein
MSKRKRPAPGPAGVSSKGALDELTLFRDKLHDWNYGVDPKVKSGEYTLEDLTDYGLNMRLLAAMFDDLRKECNARKETVGRIIALASTERVLADPTLELNVVGAMGTASPDSKVNPLIPKRGTDDYEKLLDYLGITGIAREHGLAGLHWNHLVAYLQRQSEAGQPVPEGVLRSVPNPSCVFRKHRS